MKHSDNNDSDLFEGVQTDRAGVRTDWDGDPIVAVARAVGAFVDQRPTDLPPLDDTVDGDALGRLLEQKDEATPVRISFEYQGLTVTITEREILVAEASSGA